MKFMIGMIVLLVLVLAGVWFVIDGPSSSEGSASAGRPNSQDIRDLKIN